LESDLYDFRLIISHWRSLAPMESGAAFDDFALIGEIGASFADNGVELVVGGGMLVDDGFIDQRPRGFRRL
jgi:hypothetical protein